MVRSFQKSHEHAAAVREAGSGGLPRRTRWAAAAKLSMGCDHIVMAAETYMGLPEVGVGLIPGAKGRRKC